MVVLCYDPSIPRLATLIFVVRHTELFLERAGLYLKKTLSHTLKSLNLLFKYNK